MALCDQDDRWHHDKLEALREAAGPEVTLAYSDMNLVDEDGKLLSPTYWTERRTNHTNMTSLMVANTITAAASLFPRRLLDYALPFPAPLGHAFHDHWLALVALAEGGSPMSIAPCTTTCSTPPTPSATAERAGSAPAGGTARAPQASRSRPGTG